MDKVYGDCINEYKSKLISENKKDFYDFFNSIAKTEFINDFNKNISEYPYIQKIKHILNINNYSCLGLGEELYGYAKCECPFFLIEVLKNSKKQNLYESAFEIYIKELLKSKNLILTKMPQSGKGRVVIDKDGKLSKNKCEKNQQTKAIDYRIMKNKIEINISAKYIGEPGGAQENQARDIKEFIINAGKNTDDDKIFIAIVDGDYGLKRSKDYVGLCDNKKTFICCADNFSKILDIVGVTNE